MRSWGANMQKMLAIALAAAMLSGCAAMPDEQRNALLGAASGAGVGALIGSATGGGPGAIAAGAVIGGAAGGIVGYLIRPEGCYFRNTRGELWRVPCEYTPRTRQACFVGTGPSALQQVDCPNEYRLSYKGRPR